MVLHFLGVVLYLLVGSFASLCGSFYLFVTIWNHFVVLLLLFVLDLHPFVVV